MLPARKKIMIETRRLIQKEYRVFRAYNPLDAKIEGRIFPLLTKRIKGLGIRSFFTRTMYHYILEQADANNEAINAPLEQEKVIFEQKLPFISEVIIAIQYYQNQILDGKGGLKGENEHYIKEKVDQNLIASHYIKDALYEYIDQEIYPNDPIKNRLVTKAVRRIFRYVDLGQDMQDQWGTVEHFNQLNRYVFISKEIEEFIDKDLIDTMWSSMNEDGIAEKNECFIKNYLLRIQLCNAALYSIFTELIMDLVGYSGTEHKNILKFAKFQGILGQIVNDNNDYVLPEYNLLTVNKKPEDAFADLRNNIITLPLIHYLQEKENPELLISNLKNELFPPEIPAKDSSLPWNILNFNFMIEKIGSIIPILNQNRFKETLPKLLSSIQESIETTERISMNIKKLNLIQKSTFGILLNDMNSIAEVGYNRFYQKIYEDFSMPFEDKREKSEDVSRHYSPKVVPDKVKTKFSPHIKPNTQNRGPRVKYLQSA
jgi:hypothetical protein